MPLDHAKLDQLLGRAVTDFGATFHAGLVAIGDRLGLFKAMAGAGQLAPAELAQKTDTDERYVHEWLCAQAAGGYVHYDPATDRYSLTEEQAFALANEDSPAFLPGAFQLAVATLKAMDKVADAFRTGKGVGWHEHDPDLFRGTERFFRPNYANNLVSSWIPSLADVEARLKKGGRVADIGCGHGASTILMAQVFPNSEFIGFDYHPPSIEWATRAAQQAGVGGRVKFQPAAAKEYPRKDYDFVTFFDCLHGMGDPVGAARHVLETMRKDGTWMIVEPYAGDQVADNLNPIGRAFYSASTLICTPASKAQEVGLALGARGARAQSGDRRRFAGFRRAAQTPFNLVYEARPLTRTASSRFPSPKSSAGASSPGRNRLKSFCPTGCATSIASRRPWARSLKFPGAAGERRKLPR